jgi:hypothetical protein
MTTWRVPAVLGVAFFALYLTSGLKFYFETPRVFRKLDQIFDMDVPSRSIDLTRWQGAHHRTRFHPLYVILLNPIGQSMRDVMRLGAIDRSGQLAAVVLNTMVGGATVALFFVLLTRAGIDPRHRLLWTLVFGLSSSQLIFGSMPESWIFTAFGLVFLFAAGARRTIPRDGLLVAGVIAFGMLVINIAAAVLVRARWRDPRGGKATVRAVAIYGVLVLAITALLGLAQEWLYPTTQHYVSFEPLARDDQLSFVWPKGPGDVARRAGELFANFTLFNVAAPRIVTLEVPNGALVVDMPKPSLSALSPLGLVHAAGWYALALVAAVFAWRARLHHEWYTIALLLWTVVCLCVHSVFGVCIFLYSTEWTFVTVTLVALGVQQWIQARPEIAGKVTAALAALLLLQIVNNAAFIRELLQVLAKPA